MAPEIRNVFGFHVACSLWGLFLKERSMKWIVIDHLWWIFVLFLGQSRLQTFVSHIARLSNHWSSHNYRSGGPSPTIR